MKQVKRICAQGDVLFRRVKKLPANAKKQPEAREYVVTHSETGHHHVARGQAQHYQLDAMTSYLVAQGDVQLQHQKSGPDAHAALNLLGGDEGEVVWEIKRQREQGPQGWQKVID